MQTGRYIQGSGRFAPGCERRRLKRSRLWRRVALPATLLVVAFVLFGCSQSPQTTARGGADASAGEPTAAKSEAPVRAESIAPVPAAPASLSKKPSGPESSVVSAEAAQVVRVVDGDTAVFRLKNGRQEKVRFIGVDTPESTNATEQYGKEASAYTKRQLPVGQIVYLEKDVEERDRYGRLLAYVWLAKPREISSSELHERMLNARLAADGYAQQMTVAPNVKYAEYFGRFVAEARQGGTGLWNQSLADDRVREQPADSDEQVFSHVGNRRTGKFHEAACRAVDEMREKNKVPLNSRAEAITRGYVPCKICDP